MPLKPDSLLRDLRVFVVNLKVTAIIFSR